VVAQRGYFRYKITNKLLKAAEDDMGDYILNTVNYDHKTLNHEGFGGVCKYIATPKRVKVSKASCQARKHTVRLQHLYV
jgi:hypothetical protein